MPSPLTLPVGPRDHRQGPDSAPVTLVEYGDFECPQCAAAYPIVGRLRDTFGQRLRFVFRHFPLTNSHPHAQHAAEAAEWAAAAGAFWPMYDALYAARADLNDRKIVAHRSRAGPAGRRAGDGVGRAHLHPARQRRLHERHQERRHRDAVVLHQRRRATRGAGTSSRSATRSTRRPGAPRAAQRSGCSASRSSACCTACSTSSLICPLLRSVDDGLALGGQRLGAQAAERGRLRPRSAGTRDLRASALQAFQALLVGQLHALHELRVDDRRVVDLARAA